MACESDWQFVVGELALSREHSGRTEMARPHRRLHRRGGIGKENFFANHALLRLRPDGGQLARRQFGSIARAKTISNWSVIIQSQLRAARPARLATQAEKLKSGNCSRRKFWSTTFPKFKRNWQSCSNLAAKTPKNNPAKLLDNASWTQNISYLDFLRDIGKHFSVNQMVAKESVRARMEDRETGISYTEFSYMLLQAFDFYWLASQKDENGKLYNCELQIGGSDQWGNITAGIDLCRKKLGKTVFGLTLPLITNADGTKFGKTEAGAIWLDPKRTSVYRFYQFWINTDDRDVIRYLKFFTFLSKEEIESLEKWHKEKPEARVAHQALAKAVTDLIHGENATAEADRASQILFGGKLDIISEETFNEIFGIPTTKFDAVIKQAYESLEGKSSGVPQKFIEISKLQSSGLQIVELLVHAGLCSSKGQARKDIEGGGIYANNVREQNILRAVTSNDLLFGKHIFLRKGKKNYVVVTAK